jgi:protein phosphatase
MGTTCTALVITEDHFAHVGDSRAYLLKKDKLSRITEDHTYVQELVRSGEISAADAETHPRRNILTNAMGTKPEMKVDAGRYLYCWNPATGSCFVPTAL